MCDSNPRWARELSPHEGTSSHKFQGCLDAGLDFRGERGTAAETLVLVHRRLCRQNTALT